jgi:hypothetical protein
MVGVIIAAVIWAGVNVMRPSVRRLYIGTGTLINTSVQQATGTGVAAQRR